MYKKERIKGYEEYMVDTSGIIYSKTGNPLKYSINHNGYCIVNLLTNGKRKGFAIHTLVANQFIPKIDNERWQVNHKDGNKQNNSVENLEWVTPKENLQHSVNVLGNLIGSNNPNSKSVRACDNKGHYYYFGSVSDAARFLCEYTNAVFQSRKNGIYKVLHGRRKTYMKFKWEFVK